MAAGEMVMLQGGSCLPRPCSPERSAGRIDGMAEKVVNRDYPYS